MNGIASISPTVPPIFADDKIEIVIAFGDEILDLVGDVRNDLNGGAEIIAAAFLVDDVLVDAARW